MEVGDQRGQRADVHHRIEGVVAKDGHRYEVRNRVTLCRCGASKNKPFCDGSHAAIEFKDGL